MLNRVNYDVYNERIVDKAIDRELVEPWKGVEDEIENYRQEIVEFISKTESEEGAFSKWICWLQDHKVYFNND